MSNNSIALPYLPVQNIGTETETFHSIEASSEAEANNWFNKACNRFKNINDWASYCGLLSADFVLMDEKENPLSENATIGKYIRIDVPGPGNKAGDGYDWVKIEDIKTEAISPTQKIFLIQVRPSKRPTSDKNTIAHFLTDKATSSFVITKNGTTITATVFGRNEIPNTDDIGLLGAVRNTIVGSSGAVGVSKLQWKALVNGALSFVED